MQRSLSCDSVGLVQGTKTSNPENTEKIQNPPFRFGPRKYRKTTEKIQKCPKNDHFCIFFGNFFVYSGPKPGRGILYFFVFFRISGIQGFLYPVRARRSLNLCRGRAGGRASRVDDLKAKHTEADADSLLRFPDEEPIASFKMWRFQRSCGFSSRSLGFPTPAKEELSRKGGECLQSIRNIAIHKHPSLAAMVQVLSSLSLSCESTRFLQGGKSPKSGKTGFWGQKKTPISQCSRKGRFEPFLYRAPQGKWGIFDSKRS